MYLCGLCVFVGRKIFWSWMTYCKADTGSIFVPSDCFQCDFWLMMGDYPFCTLCTYTLLFLFFPIGPCSCISPSSTLPSHQVLPNPIKLTGKRNFCCTLTTLTFGEYLFTGLDVGFRFISLVSFSTLGFAKPLSLSKLSLSCPARQLNCKSLSSLALKNIFSKGYMMISGSFLLFRFPHQNMKCHHHSKNLPTGHSIEDPLPAS